MSHGIAQTEYKITVLGSGGVGKSALTIRLITGTYEANYDPTIEDSYRKQVSIDDEPALLDILDTAGQEEYSALQDQWIREGDGFLLVFAIDSEDTFEEVKMLREKIRRIIDEDENIALVLCCNKIDLPEKEHEVSEQKMQFLAKSWNCSCVRTSAKEKINIQKVFYDVVRAIRNLEKDDEEFNNSHGKKKRKISFGSFCQIL